MLNEYEREQIRRAYYLEKKSIYRIAKDLGYSHQAIEKAIFDPLPRTYHLSHPKPAPVFGPYQPRVDALVQQNAEMPRKLGATTSLNHIFVHRAFPARTRKGGSSKGSATPGGSSWFRFPMRLPLMT